MDFLTAVGPWIAPAALLLSLISLAAQFVRARWERPVLVVRGWMVGVHPLEGAGHWRMELAIVNVGERAVTVVDVGWAILDDAVMVSYPYPRDPDLPRRLEPHDSDSWRMDYSMEGTKLLPETSRPWARVVRRPSLLDRLRGKVPERVMFGKRMPGPNVILPPKR